MVWFISKCLKHSSSVQKCENTASDMVAENNIVCLVLEHSRITSFICSAKYSSNILGKNTKKKKKNNKKIIRQSNENVKTPTLSCPWKITQNLPISNPKPDLHNINVHYKFGENLLTFTQVIVRKQKYRHWQITLSKIDEFCPLAIPNQISTVSMHIPSLWKSIAIYSSYCPERLTDNQCETIIPHHYCVYVCVRACVCVCVCVCRWGIV